jgi:UDP-N-acetylglucosamine--N-acetylmuramyl-(pentapeptide) pyrophosphoryl-undecaprenol N-acetylglucosamine transferase
VPEAGFPLELIQIGALKSVSLARRVRTFFEMPMSLVAANAILDRVRPAAVFSVGGYSSGPIMVMAASRDIPIVIMEPNAAPGLANRIAGPFASCALLGFPQAAHYFPAGRSLVTGIPIRDEFFDIEPKPHAPPFTLLITGGSLGAQRLNQAVSEALALWSNRGWLAQLKFLHQTGEREYNKVRAVYEMHGAIARAAPFFNDMPGLFAQADAVICRSGASTVAELCAAGKASLLVPYPFAADQHQLRNARAMEHAGAARLVLDAELTGERLVAEVERLLGVPGRLNAMEGAARRLALRGAAERAADVLEDLAAGIRRRMNYVV